MAASTPNDTQSPPNQTGGTKSLTSEQSTQLPVEGAKVTSSNGGAAGRTGSVASSGRPKSNAEGIILPDLCGNGKLDAYETCDDGNRNWGDGCSGICTAEAVDLAMMETSVCVITNLGTLKCWGMNAGLLGYGDVNNRGDEPGEMGQALPTIDLGHVGRVKAVSGSGTHVCALLESGRVKCWGTNCYGQLGQPIAVLDRGDGSGPCKVVVGDAPGEMGDALPFIDLGHVPVTQLLVGADYSCALLSSGQVKCWGSNTGHGQKGLHHLGDDTGEMGEHLPVVKLGKGRRALKLVGAYHSTCAILDDYKVHCWGDVYRKKHIHIYGNDQLAVGQEHSCILGAKGLLRCWGDNGSGQLGYPNLAEDDYGHVYLDEPLASGVNLGKGRTAVSVAVGDLNTCVILDDNSIKCWGYNGQGQLGVGHDSDTKCFSGTLRVNPCRTTPPEQPIFVGSRSKVKKIAMGGSTVCGLFDDARIKCWGYNGGGALGLGDTVNRDRPPEQYVAY